MNDLKLTIFTGKISTFGGSSDSGMTRSEGSSCYEHSEADKRPDLFFPRSEDLSLGVSQRMRSEDALYFACRYPLKAFPRSMLQNTNWLFINPKTGAKACLWLVDWGPHPDNTDKDFDISPFAARCLGLQSGDLVEVMPFITRTLNEA